MTDQYKCQLHGLPHMTQGEIRLRPGSPGKRLRLMIHRNVGRRTKERVKRSLVRILGWYASLSSDCQATSAPSPAKVAGDNLEAGDLVRVRSLPEIKATLNPLGAVRGCSFMREMAPYCGTTQRVFKRVNFFLDERDYRVKKACAVVLLEGLFCEGTALFGPCDRSCLFFWAEEWLEKMD